MSAVTLRAPQETRTGESDRRGDEGLCGAGNDGGFYEELPGKFP